MYKKHLFIALLIFIFKFNSLIAQNEFQNNLLDRYIPPSPSAQSIQKINGAKNNEFTGAVNYSIPLFEISDGPLSTKLSLDYNSGGFIVNQDASRIGLGWDIAGIGIISREVYGLPDNQIETSLGGGFLETVANNNYSDLISADETSEFQTLELISDGCLDSQPDVFSFNVNGIKGKFNFNWNSEIVISCSEDVDIEPIWESGFNSKLNGWILKTKTGVEYKFEEAESTIVEKWDGNYCGLGVNESFNSSWLLTEISTTDGLNAIYFQYDDYTIESQKYIAGFTRMHQVSSYEYCSGTIQGTLRGNITETRILGKKLSSISTMNTNELIEFNDGAERQDIQGTGSNELRSISQKNTDNGNIMREFEFSHNYSTGRLTLESMETIAGTNSTNKHDFDYYSSLPDKYSYNIDHWGFSNGANNSNLIPSYKVDNPADPNRKYFISGADRSPNIKSRQGMLKQITFPTGGYQIINYELHDYSFINGSNTPIEFFEYEDEYETLSAYGDTNFGCGTLDENIQEKNITISSPEDLVEVELTGSINLYTDDYFAAGYGPYADLIDTNTGDRIAGFNVNSTENPIYLEIPPGNYKLIASATWKDCNNSSLRDRAIITIKFKSATTTEPLQVQNAGGVRVESIEYYNNKILEKSEVYNYSDRNNTSLSSGHIKAEPKYLYYDVVTETDASINNGNTGFPCGKLFAISNNVLILNNYQGSHIAYENIEKYIDFKNENGYQVSNYKITPDIINDELPFAPSTTNTHKTGVLKDLSIYNNAESLEKTKSYDYLFYENNTNGLKVNYTGVAHELHYFFMKTYKVRSGFSRISNIEELEYLDNQTYITSSKSFNYSSTGKYLKSKTISTEDQSLVTDYFYAYNVSSPNSSVSELKTLSKDGYPVEIINSKIGFDGVKKVSNSIANVYDNGMLFKVYQNGNKIGVNYSQMAKIYSNSGNLTSAYNSSLPEVTYDYYSDGKIKEQISKNGQAVEIEWGYDYQYPIVKAENLQGTSLATAINNSLPTGYSTLDGLLNSLTSIATNSTQQNRWESFNSSLRNNNGEAFFTTFTYKPLVGITSKTDPLGNTTYYMYDEFNRLLKVKDQDGNIIKEYEYNYGDGSGGPIKVIKDPIITE